MKYRKLICLLAYGFISPVLPISKAVAEDTTGSGETEEPAAAAMSEADRETMALDSTATQWSFQFSYNQFKWAADTLDNGSPRPEGNDRNVQLRVVAPLPGSMTGLPFTILPRLTARYAENQNGDWGFTPTEIFALCIAQDWGSGRWGVGPLVNIPGSSDVGADEWSYGLAGAIVNGSGNWFYGLLLTQSFKDAKPGYPSSSDTNPLGIVPIVSYKLGDGWYVSNGDMVAQYDWDTGGFYLPIALRVGKIFVEEKGSWNIYAEYRTSLIKNNWDGAAHDGSFRLNVTYSMPVN
jgi:hypothetical protein